VARLRPARLAHVVALGQAEAPLGAEYRGVWSVRRVRRSHECAEDPQNRDEDPEEEQPPVSVTKRPEAEPDHENEPDHDIEPADSPPHAHSSRVAGCGSSRASDNRAMPGHIEDLKSSDT